MSFTKRFLQNKTLHMSIDSFRATPAAWLKLVAKFYCLAIL